MDTLTYFQDNIGLKYIYCIQDTGNKTFAFSVDPTAEDPGEFGSPIVYTDALYRASQGTPAVDDEPYEDAWGTFYSAYSPVCTSSGEVGGIVAVDFSADWYDQQVSDLVRTVITFGVISLLIGILIVTIIARRERKRNRVLHGQLNELADKVEELVQAIESGTILEATETETSPKTLTGTLQGEDVEALGAKILTMQDQIRGHIEYVHELAYLDGLTGIGNRTAYLDIVEHLDKMIHERIAQFAIALFDLNGMKRINDEYGHECGDIALIDVVEALKTVLGKERLYRIGGDEFIVILPHTAGSEMEQLFRLVEEELTRINQTEWSYEVPLALAKGGAVYMPGEDADFKAVFKRADQAMYEDKWAYYETHGDPHRR